MKRSEMLDLMVKTVLDEEYTSDFCRHFAELILDAQEQAGMLPPVESIHPICLDSKYGSVFEISYSYPIDENGQFPLWEPEEGRSN